MTRRNLIKKSYRKERAKGSWKLLHHPMAVQSKRVFEVIFLERTKEKKQQEKDVWLFLISSVASFQYLRRGAVRPIVAPLLLEIKNHLESSLLWPIRRKVLRSREKKKGNFEAIMKSVKRKKERVRRWILFLVAVLFIKVLKNVAVNAQTRRTKRRKKKQRKIALIVFANDPSPLHRFRLIKKGSCECFSWVRWNCSICDCVKKW